MNWAEWAEDEYEAGVISAENLVDYDCVDWKRAGEIFNDGYEMTQNGTVFCTAF